MSPSARPWRPAHPNPTDRELDVLLGISDGKTNASIGEELGIAEDTVKKHASHLYKRIDARDRAHAVRIGFDCGWLVPHASDAERVTLKPRLLQILQLIAMGIPFDVIGLRMNLSPVYVKELSKPLYEALGARDRAHAVRRGFEFGLLVTAGGKRG